jgi:DNA-binding transcriptional regulator YdaS (Cro superfamily)
MPDNVSTRAVQRAALLAGGRDALARRLGVTRAQIDQWVAAKRRPTMAMLLRLVEFILDKTG